jgi:SAM-dependent methyltransferase
MNFESKNAPMLEKPYRAEICNICDSPHFTMVRHFDNWSLGREPVLDVSIVRCLVCGIRRRAPGLMDDYEEEYHAPYVEQGNSIHPHQLSHFADLMTERLPQPGRSNSAFLDIGCSTGRALRLAETLGFKAIGLDYSKWATEYCSKLGFETRQGTLLGQWIEGELFDTIHCSHTIEHVPDPVAYLQEISRLLIRGGHLMIAFPNYNSIPRIVMGADWPVWCLDSHLWQFTSGQLLRLLKQQGFTIASCRTLHGYHPNSKLKRRVLDISSVLGLGDGCNIVARKD